MKCVFLAFVITFCCACPSGAEQVLVRVDAPDNVSPRVADIRSVYAAGITPNHQVLERVNRQLPGLGFRSLRIFIHEQRDIVSIRNNAVSITKHNPENLALLTTCNELGLSPHFIVGMKAPQSLLDILNAEGTSDRFWRLYEAYIRIKIRYLSDHVKSDRLVVEVASEMDSFKNNWVVGRRLKNLDNAYYRAFIDLYAHIGSVVQKMKHEDGLTILFGGPGFHLATTNTYWREQPREENWITWFIRDVVAKGLPCDFVSFHYYADKLSGEELLERITWFKDDMGDPPFPIWISEWGPIANYKSYGPPVFRAPAAASFMFSFTETVAGHGISNGILLKVSGKHEAGIFQRPDFKPTYLYHGLSALSSLPGERVQTSSSSAALHCIGTREGGRLHVLVWNLDWMHYCLSQPSLGKMQSSAPEVLDLKISGAGSESLKLIGCIRNGETVDTADFMGWGKAGENGMEFARVPLSWGEFLLLEFMIEGTSN